MQDAHRRVATVEEAAQGTDRRNFLLGTTGSIAGLAVTSQTAHAATLASGNKAIPRPEGLGEHAMIDARFPITYEDTVPNGIAALTRFFKAIQTRDMRALAEALHFPFGTYEGVEAVIVQSPDELASAPPPSLNMIDTPERYTPQDGYMKAGSYDLFLGIEVLNWDPVSCCMAMTYDRYDRNGKRLLRCEGVYTATNNDGRWGIELMSTIFTPDHMVGTIYETAIEAAKRSRRLHTLAGSYETADADVDRASYQPRGTKLRLSAGGEGVSWRSGPRGTIMDVYRIDGVKSRLVATDEPYRNSVTDSYRDLFKMTGVGNWGFLFANPNLRAVHQTVDKVHLWSGAARFTTSGEFISMDTDLEIITFRKNIWGNAGTLAYTTVHDRANDVTP